MLPNRPQKNQTMNRITSFSLVAVLLLVFGSVYAQSTISIGPRLGANFSTFVGDDSNAETNTAIVAGLTSTYSINEKSGLGLDLLYSREGAESNFGDTNVKLDYLRLPITFQYFFRSWEDDFRPKLYLGVVPGVLLQAEVADLEVKESYNSFDVAATAGAGFNYRSSRNEPAVWLNTDFRYWRGLTNVLDDVDAELFNQSWQLSLGLAFGLN